MKTGLEIKDHLILAGLAMAGHGCGEPAPKYKPKGKHAEARKAAAVAKRQRRKGTRHTAQAGEVK